MSTIQGYEHQLEVHKKDGTVYEVYIVSHGSGYTFIVYRDGGHVYSDVHVHDSIDAAFQTGFEWVKAQK